MQYPMTAATVTCHARNRGSRVPRCSANLSSFANSSSRTPRAVPGITMRAQFSNLPNSLHTSERANVSVALPTNPPSTPHTASVKLMVGKIFLGAAEPESGNNAGAQTSFIPVLTLGIPGNPTMAMMIGALMIDDVAPGPRVMTDRPGLFWGLIASMWLGNLMLVILNLPMVGVWVRLLRVPYRLLYPAIIVFCCIGAYTINSKPFDTFVMAFFAVFGYVALKLDCEPAPLILGFVLGPMMEENLRRALLISRGDPMVFLQEPISLAFLVVAAGLLAVIAAPAIRVKREEALKE